MERIDINGYKSIQSLKLELRPINILIGANGSGKSNFLSFFEFLKTIYNQGLQEYVAMRGGLDKFLFEGRKTTDEISTHLYFGKNGYSFRIKSGEDAFIFSNEGLWYNGNPYLSNQQEIASLSTESRISNATISRASYIRKYLNSLEKYHFHDTSRNSPFAKLSNIHNDIYRLYDKGDNLAAFLYQIEKEDIVRYRLIVKMIQSVAPYFRGFSFNPNDNGDLRLQWNDRFSSVTYGVNDLSDGTKRFIALATLFLQPKLPQTIIIDEPELGLHPSAISKLAGMIHSVAKKNCQVIIATQSTDLIGFFDAEDIVTVDQIDGKSVFRRLDSKELSTWLNEYSLGELWKRNFINQGQPFSY